MHHRRHKILLAILAWSQLVWFSCVAWGQTDLGRTSEPPQVEGKIKYVGPDTYLLLDAEGRPQPVLGMTYEEFVAAWKKLEHVDVANAEPRFTIDELTINGEASDDRAELNVELTIQSHVGGTLKLPLGMKDAILLEQPQLKVLGEPRPAAGTKPLVGYEPQSGGYVVWIAGAPRQRYQLSFKLLRPLVRDGNEERLALNLPRALVSRLSLTFPTPVVNASITPSLAVDNEAMDGGGTRLNVSGPSGDFRLSWNIAMPDRPELSTVLSATGAIAITIDGHSIRSDAHLSVRSYGGTLERFRVRLPPGARLLQDRPADPAAEAPGYRLILADVSTASDDGAQIVTVELAQKQLGPVEVDLSTEQPLGLPTAERAVELAGFAVLDAVRQYGDVAISVADDWQLRWENGPYVRQVGRNDLPPALREAQPSLAFQYDRQPWSMHAQLVVRPMVVHVTPAYQLELGVDEARLDMHLDFQVPGARAFEFRVELAGWELTPEPIESGGLVDRDRVLVTRDGVLALPLAQASSRRAEIDLRLRRPLERAATAIVLPLPIPTADTVAPAELNVTVDSAIELLPDNSASRGISPTPVLRDTAVPPAPDGQQTFHFQTDVPGAVFAAQRSLRPRETVASVETRLELGLQRLQAKQDIHYRVKYRPLTELTLELPNGWSLIGDQIEVVPPTPGAEPAMIATVTGPASPGRAVRIARAVLPQPRIGLIAVRAKYKIDESLVAFHAGANELSLPRTVDAGVVEHRVALTAPSDIVVSLDATADSTWQPIADPNAKSALVLSTNEPADVLPLIVQPANRGRPRTASVERIWLQSWQAGNTIQDRAAIKFRTSGSEVAIELPPLSVGRDVEVLLDGDLARVAQQEVGRLTVAVPRAVNSSEHDVLSHTLEIRYRRPAPEGLVVRYVLTPPQIVGTSTLSEVYWHVVLPGDRHIVQTPGQLAPVDPRQWLEVFWGRTESMAQAELEAWAGATKQLGPATAQNAYLYSGLSPASSIELVSAPRWLIVLVASGAVLAIASLGIYVSPMRRGWIVLLLAAIVVGLAIAYPEPALLVGQASVLGVVLAAIALALRRWTSTRVIPRVATTGGSTNMRMRTSIRTDSYHTPSPTPLVSGVLLGGTSVSGTSSSGTPTAPLVVLPEVER